MTNIWQISYLAGQCCTKQCDGQCNLVFCQELSDEQQANNFLYSATKPAVPFLPPKEKCLTQEKPHKKNNFAKLFHCEELSTADAKISPLLTKRKLLSMIWFENSFKLNLTYRVSQKKTSLVDMLDVMDVMAKWKVVGVWKKRHQRCR